ncbi:LysR family transcriptional regulator [Kineosporia succinea]|uniref:DNA-binding transcriptional LysR family regulator n=1 Tax=Kineosporia succinea TaxID=84632 RepID=A0ABT9PBL4_9ACTN|nr:LysR family transcriptional regulator [Kineosporia succinea]MDP9830093.1 DNA-binding transcriptional LysR family regulator [Kineosporia succinea]
MTKAFTLLQLRYFVVTARLGNMTASARELHMTQSALSSAIGQLEASMGAALFRRVPRRGLELTDAGRRLLDECLPLIEEVDRLPSAVRGDEAGAAGSLVVGVYEPLASHDLPRLLREFGDRHPAVDVHLLEGDQEATRRAVTDGLCEVALMYDMAIGPGIDYEPLEVLPAHVIVASDHPLADRTEVGLRELDGEPLILLDLPSTRDYIQDVFAAAGVTPRIRHRFRGYEAVRAFVGDGHGYAVLNRRLAHGLTHNGGSVTALDISDEVPAVRIVLATRTGTRPTRRAREFRAMCGEFYGNAPLT